MLARTLNARNVLTEMEIVVWGGWKMVDFIADVGRTRVGCSITRAMSHPHPALFDQEEADRLIEKKLSGLVIARRHHEAPETYARPACYLDAEH